MEGRGANFNKVRQKAENRSKTKVPTRTIQQSITTTPPETQEQPFIGNAAMFMEPSQTPSTISTPQELRSALTPMASVPIDRTNIQQVEPEDPESERFLASLIAQGLTGLGAGLMGGSSQDILRSTGMFDRMRESDINRQDRLRQAELLRTERLGEKQERLAEIKKREDQAKSLTDKNSEESKRRRQVYKSLGLDVPDNLSYTDLNDPVVLQSLRDKLQQQKLAAMPRGGVGGAKPEKEIKSNQKSMAEYREHVSSLAEMGNVLNKIKLLNRTGIGTITPDFSVDTQAYSTSLDRAAQPMIKTLAGPGTLQKEERDTYGKLVPTGNTRADLALRQANDIIVEGTDKALSKMNADLSTGDISKKDYDALINQYNEQLSKKGIGINQIINPNTGRLETRQKREVTLKDGKKVIVDQFGYTWE